uniref:Checkpoint protein n=1 Tax=Strongyloides stercoralis TaxID=6248 RepID=A0A0K0E1E0_STRER
MSIEINKFYAEICDLTRLHRLITPLGSTSAELTIVVSNDGLRFVSENGPLLQTIIYYNSRNILKLEKNGGTSFIMIKIPTNDFLNTLKGCGYTDTVAKLSYNEEINGENLRVVIDETITKATFNIHATPTITTTMFKEKMNTIVQVCTLVSKPFSHSIQYVSEFTDEVKIVVSPEGIYFYSFSDGSTFDCSILTKGENILEVTSSFVDTYWYTSKSLRKLLPYLNLSKFCKIKISRNGTLEFKIEFNDSEISVNSVQIWIAGINDPTSDGKVN